MRTIILSEWQRNKYCLNLKKLVFTLNYISQKLHFDFSCIIKRSHFKLKGLKRKRLIITTMNQKNILHIHNVLLRLLIETILQHSTLIISSRRGHSINVSDNIYRRCPCFLRSWIFWTISDRASRFLSYLEMRIINRMNFSFHIFHTINFFITWRSGCSGWWILCLLMLQVQATTRTVSGNFFEFSENFISGATVSDCL